ncbi:MAG: CPBP family intramembrane glutamic endopeptidase [Pyrobaculum sp.]
MVIRLMVTAAFIAGIAALAIIKPPACAALYGGTLYYAAFLPAGYLARWRLGRGFPLAYGVYFLSLTAAGLLILASPQILQSYNEVREAQARYFSAASQCPLGRPLLVMQAVFLAPLVEEVVFRGLLFEEVRGRWGTASAYLISSLGFALLHNPGLGAVPIFIVALSLAFAYHRYGLPASIMLHATQNTLAMFIH